MKDDSTDRLQPNRADVNLENDEICERNNLTFLGYVHSNFGGSRAPK